jgi:hypothetical protein
MLLASKIPLYADDLPSADLEISVDQDDSHTLMISKDVTIPAEKTYKSVVIINGKVEFFGQTENLILVNGAVKLHPGSKVTRQLVVLNGNVEQMKGAESPEASVKILGRFGNWKDKFKSRLNEWLPSNDSVEGFFSGLARFLFLPLALAVPLAIFVILTVIAMIFLSVAPQLSRLADETFLRSPIASLGWGVLGFLAFTPIVVLMVISIVGIPIIPLFVLFCLLLALAGFFTVCRGLGHWLLSKMIKPSRFVSTLVGLVILFALTFMPIIGSFVGTTALLLGTGAILRALLYRDRHPRPSYLDDDVYDIP